MAPPLLVFDLDGTLVETAPDLVTALYATLDMHAFQRPEGADFREGIGHGARHLIEYALHQQQVAADPAKLDAMLADFLLHYEAHIADESLPFPGLSDLLDRFDAAGWRFAVCTNKLEGLSRVLLGKLGLISRFDAICGGDSFATRKPDPAHLLGTIAAAGGLPESAVMVGDSRTDVDTARAAGVAVVGVTFGYTPVPMAELEPDFLIDSFDDLTPEAARGLLAAVARRSEKVAAAIP
jgi:phosphoglycolate phosphatase